MNKGAKNEAGRCAARPLKVSLRGKTGIEDQTLFPAEIFFAAGACPSPAAAGGAGLAGVMLRAHLAAGLAGGLTFAAGLRAHLATAGLLVAAGVAVADLRAGGRLSATAPAFAAGPGLLRAKGGHRTNEQNDSEGSNQTSHGKNLLGLSTHPGRPRRSWRRARERSIRRGYNRRSR